jgi:aspartate-semialdehyde dehydrogenase
MTYAGREHEVFAAARLEEASAQRGDIAMVALDDEHSKRFVPRLLELGYRVIDKSNTYRADERVPLVAAGVNHELVTDAVRLVANPNCTTIPLTLALAPLQRRFGLVSANVSTYQAISGAGVVALDEFLADSRRGYAEPDRLGQRFEPRRYAGNTFPHNGNTDASGFSSEERKLVFESRKILRLPGFAISAQCCRVPVAVGHYESAWVTLGKKASLDEIAGVLGDVRAAPFVRFLPGAAGDGLTPLDCVRDRDRTLAGRLRLDDRDASGRSLCLTVVADNLRLGAATNAVRIASRWFPVEDTDLGVAGLS